jgi:hypothetical protein
LEQSAKRTSGLWTQATETMKDTLDGLTGTVAGVGGQVDLLGGQVQLVHSRIERLDEGLADTDDKLGGLDNKLGSVDARIAARHQAGTPGRAPRRPIRPGERSPEPLTDELRSHLGHTEIRDAVAKIIDAASSDVTAHLGSLEETVLTLAEALLWPQGRQVPIPREGDRI